MDEDMGEIIRLAIKKGKRGESKIPFKNVMNVPLTLDIEWLDD